MNISSRSLLHRLLIGITLSTFLVALTPGLPTRAESISDLQQQKDHLDQQAKDAEQKAKNNKTLAQRAQERLQSVTQQINDIETTLNSTESQINSTNSSIKKRNQELDALKVQLRSAQDRANALVRELYIATLSRPDNLSLFSNEPISVKEERNNQLTALRKATAELVAQTEATKKETEQKLADLNEKQRSLENLRDEQANQKISLATIRQQQSSLRNNAESAQRQYESRASSARSQASQIAARIQELRTITNWGGANGQIISSNEWWYQTQVGNRHEMGNSGLTINGYGCYITSIAMVRTYYGHPTTNTSIAANSGNFTPDGYYKGSNTPLGGAQAVNWAIVQREVAAGRPVIVSIYLPQVGALNWDGSSHFVVIKGYASGKYLMHDPLGNSRNYSLNQVRTMRLTHPY